jgi:hypothetical protein
LFSPKLSKIAHRELPNAITLKSSSSIRAKTFIASPFCYMIGVAVLMKDEGIDIELPTLLPNIAYNALW